MAFTNSTVSCTVHTFPSCPQERSGNRVDIDSYVRITSPSLVFVFLPSLTNTHERIDSVYTMNTLAILGRRCAILCSARSGVVRAAWRRRVHTLHMPSVDYLVRKHNLSDAEVKSITGSGVRGTILKGDVLAFVKGGKKASAPATQTSSASGKPAASAGTSSTSTGGAHRRAPTRLVKEAPFEEHKNTGMRRVIAQRLLESKTTVPHAYSSLDIDVSDLLRLRKQFIEKHSLKVSVNTFVIRAVAQALTAWPSVGGQLGVRR